MQLSKIYQTGLVKMHVWKWNGTEEHPIRELNEKTAKSNVFMHRLHIHDKSTSCMDAGRGISMLHNIPAYIRYSLF